MPVLLTDNEQYVVTADYYAYETAARIIVEPSFAILGLAFMSGSDLWLRDYPQISHIPTGWNFCA